ncbi:expressed unknown protein [Seminavis robusta]|uniref:C2 domain-containing protein n=1 Tax=Seminavis robusta TaxID=568900 RepID=A0A9N8HK93_9STRA|nr:expressed unknown protein [Seminavis robusta]|eukprot:Sro923_g220720.1 n/a (212) ;mRNA; f:19989-20830
MGTATSKLVESGVLQGAYAPPVEGLAVPAPLEGGKECEVVIPKDKKKGDTFLYDVGKGRMETLTVPKGKKPGDTIMHRTMGEIEKVIASTLHAIPGFIVIQSKPVIWSTASKAFFKASWNDQKENLSMAKAIGKLMQEAQESMLSKAIDLGCNAVLGMTVNITTDSSGSEGNSKLVIVTVCGTPCAVCPAGDIPAVKADVVVEPLYLNQVL